MDSVDETLKPIGWDASGYELLTNAMRDLLYQYPGLGSQTIRFEELNESFGIAFSSDGGALVLSEKRSITDHVSQVCQYSFLVVYRSGNQGEEDKIYAQSFLENIGKWLCMEPFTIDGESHRLIAYPDLTDGRKITRVTRSNAYGTVPNANKSQDWILPVTVQYTYEFDLGTDWW